MNIRRTKVMLETRSQAESGRMTAPIWPLSSWRFSNSGRTGGTRGCCATGPWFIARSAMGDLRGGALVLDALGEQHVVDAPGQLHELGALLLGVAELVRVELRLDPAGMRREHQDARADDDRLLDRVGDEQHGEA